jgi:hypothetical protein
VKLNSRMHAQSGIGGPIAGPPQSEPLCHYNGTGAQAIWSPMTLFGGAPYMMAFSDAVASVIQWLDDRPCDS